MPPDFRGWGLASGGWDELAGMGNQERKQPTSNILHPTSNEAHAPNPLDIGCWLLLVRCFPISTFFQARADQLLHGCRRTQHRLRGADGVVRLDLLEAQRHERERGVVRLLVVRRKRMFCARG